MAAVPISEFEHRVAKWIAHLEKTRQPLEISQRGRTKMVAIDAASYERLLADQELLHAIEIKLLIEAGERDVAKGRLLTHEQVEKMALGDRRRKRRS
jgi:PHD/YefM family antitoxin component YafN of YafNO toxin-antitoxin module